MTLVAVSPVCAEPIEGAAGAFYNRSVRDPLAKSWPSCKSEAAAPAPLTLTVTAAMVQQASGQPVHAAAIEHSDAYQKRAKIHKYASFATLPLFATEVALGQSLYNTPADAGGKRTAHAVVGTSIIGLFGLNTVTGAWNLFGEGWQDKEGRTLRLIHGLLMMAADAGFVATTLNGPNSHSIREAPTFEADKVKHRNLAIASISVGTAGYLLMLFGNH